MCSEIVGIKDNIGAVGLFIALFRFKGAAQGVGRNHGRTEGAEQIIDIGVQHGMSVFFFELDVNFALIVDEVSGLMDAGFRAGEIGVPVHPYGQFAFMRRGQLGHVRNIRIHIELGNPFVIGRIVIHDMRADLAVFREGLVFLAVAHDGDILGRPFLDKDIVVETVIAVQDGHEAHDFRAVRHMIGRIARTGAAADAGECAADQVVHHGHALGGQTQGGFGKKNIVIDECGAMTDFDKDVLAHHAALEDFGECRFLVVMQEVLGDAGALGFPVGPDTHGAVMDVVPAHDDVDGGMQLDAGNLGPAQFHHVIDVMDMVVLNDTEDSAHTADDAALLAVMDVVAADDVAADIGLGPAVVLAAADSVALHLRRALDMFDRKVVIVVRVEVLAQGDAGALAGIDFAVLNDPAAGPVRSDHAVLIGGRRCPGCGRLADREAGDRNIAHPGFVRHEAFPAHVDFHLFLIRVSTLEIGVEHGTAAFLLAVPFIDGFLRHPGAGIDGAFAALLEGGGLIEHPVIEIDAARMLGFSGEIPVAVDERGIRIVRAEHTVVDSCAPDIAVEMFPVFHFFGTGDDGAERHFTLVGDAVFRRAGMDGIDIFAVDAGCNRDGIAGHGDAGGFVDPAERSFFASVAVKTGCGIDINDHGKSSCCMNSVRDPDGFCRVGCWQQYRKRKGKSQRQEMMEMQKKKPGLRAFHDIPDRHLIGSISCVFFAGAGRFLFGLLWLRGYFLFGILSAQNLIGEGDHGEQCAGLEAPVCRLGCFLDNIIGSSFQTADIFLRIGGCKGTGLACHKDGNIPLFQDAASFHMNFRQQKSGQGKACRRPASARAALSAVRTAAHPVRFLDQKRFLIHFSLALRFPADGTMCLFLGGVKLAKRRGKSYTSREMSRSPKRTGGESVWRTWCIRSRRQCRSSC